MGRPWVYGRKLITVTVNSKHNTTSYQMTKRTYCMESLDQTTNWTLQSPPWFGASLKLIFVDHHHICLPHCPVPHTFIDDLSNHRRVLFRCLLKNLLGNFYLISTQMMNVPLPELEQIPSIIKTNSSIFKLDNSRRCSLI